MLTPQELQLLEKILPSLPPERQKKALQLIDEYKAKITQVAGTTNFLDFIRAVYPGYKVGPHHYKLAQIIEDIASGKKKRVMVSIAPRHGKSEMLSYLAPAWFLGKFPEKQIIMASHTADLATNFGRRVRNLVGSDDYHAIFPNVTLQADSKSASRWGTNQGGSYFACGVGAALAGRGADLCLIDDPHSEQEAMQGRPEVFDAAWEWFQSGPLQRLMPNGAIIIVMTRWSKSDLVGRIIEHMTKNPGSDQWEVVEFPAILDNGEALWPEFWSVEELLAKKAAMDPRYWSAQYLQNPTSEEAALVKREWWQEWPHDNPPHCSFVIMTLDAAQEATSRADYNALQIWGVFRLKEDGPYNIILLDAIKERMEFPDLKKLVLDQHKKWEPDSFIVEKKSNGAALYQELRRMGIPVGEFTPGKGQDKISRVNAVTDIFSSGFVWYPQRRWALDVVEEVAEFPAGRHDDQVDAMTLALMRFRQGGFLQLPIDEADPVRPWRRRAVGYY